MDSLLAFNALSVAVNHDCHPTVTQARQRIDLLEEENRQLREHAEHAKLTKKALQCFRGFLPVMQCLGEVRDHRRNDPSNNRLTVEDKGEGWPSWEIPSEHLKEFTPVLNGLGYKVSFWQFTLDPPYEHEVHIGVTIEWPPFRYGPEEEDETVNTAVFWPTDNMPDAQWPTDDMPDAQ